MKKITLFSIALTLLVSVSSLLCFANTEAKYEAAMVNANDLDNDYVMLSVQFLQNVIDKRPTKSMQDRLAAVSAAELNKNLVTDEQKKAFWINVYNAYIQIILRKSPELYENKTKFFGEPRFTVAKKKLSFDDVEHGIIRSSELKLALGLIKNPFADEFEKQFRTVKTDSRIHFALNCGAKSCPLVAVYKASDYDAKVDRVAKSFLKKVSRYDAATKTVHTTTLFNWFVGDFGGPDGVKQTLRKYGIIPEKGNVNVKHDEYDWTLALGLYYEGQ